MGRFVRAMCLSAVVSVVSVASVAFAQDGADETHTGEVQEESAAPEAAAPGPSAASEHDGDGTIRDRSVHASRPLGVSGMLYIPWYHGIGIGLNARVEIPVVKDGFIPQINDQFSIEPSFGIAYTTNLVGSAFLEERLKFLNITPAVYGLWSFHITPKFRPYGALGLGYNVGMWLNNDIAGFRNQNNNFFFWDLAVGCFYNISEHFALRGELGAQGPKFGLAGFF